MNKNLYSFGLAVYILLALIGAALGLLPGMSIWLTLVMLAILVPVPFVHKALMARRFVAWEPGLSVGIQSIDEDHKKLLTLINHLQTAIYYPTGEDFERQALKELVDYTKYHFKREEDLMEQHGYPGFEGHRELHRKMITEVEGYLKSYETDPEGTVERLASFLKNWLIKHIQGTDQQYSPFLKEKTVV
jgi:hemerythrin-like metal-binding protein